MNDFTDALNDALVCAGVRSTGSNREILASKITPTLHREAQEWGWSDTEVFAQLYRLTEESFDDFTSI